MLSGCDDVLIGVCPAVSSAAAAAVAAAGAAASDSVAWQSGGTDRPFSRLMEPLYQPWQLVQEAEESDRRISNLSTVSAEDAKLIMKRCRQLKNRALAQMDQQYKAKVRPARRRLNDFRMQVVCHGLWLEAVYLTQSI